MWLEDSSFQRSIPNLHIIFWSPPRGGVNFDFEGLPVNSEIGISIQDKRRWLQGILVVILRARTVQIHRHQKETKLLPDQRIRQLLVLLVA